MALGDEIVVRLIVWQGQLQQGPTQQKQISVYSHHLKESINESVTGTQWRYQMWRIYELGSTGKHKFEVRIKHPKISRADGRSGAIHELCSRLLNSNLATKLRLLNPGVSFTFCPSREGKVSDTDEAFARCFSVAVVIHYCVGDTHSRELERMRDNFLDRNSTKYLYQPMIAAYTAADLAERYAGLIEKILAGIDLISGKTHAGLNFRQVALNMAKEAMEGKTKPQSEASTRKPQPSKEQFRISDETPDPSKSSQENIESLKLAIAIGCWMTRAFLAFAPALKEQLEPRLKELNAVIIKGRLTLASQAYINASTAPVEALSYLQSRDSPTSDDIAMTINSFGSLMQSTLPLFDVTLTITDAEFATVTGLAAGAGVSLAALGGGGIWMLCAGAAAGPVGLVALAGCATMALGTAAIMEGTKWGQRQETNPTAVLLSIQKTLEECCRFLLGLLFMAAEQNEMEDVTHLEKVQELKKSLSSDQFLKPGYMKAYYKNVSLKLANEMEDLVTGLRRHGARIVMASS